MAYTLPDELKDGSVKLDESIIDLIYQDAIRYAESVEHNREALDKKIIEAVHILCVAIAAALAYAISSEIDGRYILSVLSLFFASFNVAQLHSLSEALLLKDHASAHNTPKNYTDMLKKSNWQTTVYELKLHQLKIAQDAIESNLRLQEKRRDYFYGALDKIKCSIVCTFVMFGLNGLVLLFKGPLIIIASLL